MNGVTVYQNGLRIDDKLRSKNGTTVRYFLTNHLGSTEALTDASGAITSSTSYDSFGNATAGASIATSYRYTGREYDADTGLYYYRNRWYDPEIGRFISEDPIGFAGGDVNLYGYVGNNPHGYIDPFGFWRCSSNDPPGSSGWWDVVQGALDVAGLAPVVGLPADVLNAAISTARGNYADAALSMAAAVPVLGTAAGTAKIAKSASNIWKVGSYKKLKGLEAGLDAHHVGQKALMKKLVPGYDPNTAPSILVPKVGHTIKKGDLGVVSRSTKGLETPRQVVARDIKELRRVYPDIPNSQLKRLIDMNKNLYQNAMTK